MLDEPDLKPEQATGALYGIVPPTRVFNHAPPEWNHMRILLQDQHLTVDQNGHRILETNLDNFKALFVKHPGLARNKGRIGLQSLTNKCEFRELWIRPLAGK